MYIHILYYTEFFQFIFERSPFHRPILHLSLFHTHDRQCSIQIESQVEHQNSFTIMSAKQTVQAQQSDILVATRAFLTAKPTQQTRPPTYCIYNQILLAKDVEWNSFFVCILEIGRLSSDVRRCKFTIPLPLNRAAHSIAQLEPPSYSRPTNLLLAKPPYKSSYWASAKRTHLPVQGPVHFVVPEAERHFYKPKSDFRSRSKSKLREKIPPDLVEADFRRAIDSDIAIRIKYKAPT